MTDQQISMLFDIADTAGVGLPPERLADLLELIVEGYVEGQDGSASRYKLTEDGKQLLAERGIGTNEA